MKTDFAHRWGDDLEHVDAPVLIRLGYSASPADFDAGLPDFERFITLLQFDPPKVNTPAPGPTTNGF